MTEEQIQHIIDVIEQIGSAAFSNGWPILLKQVYVEVVNNLFTACILFFAMALCIYFYKKAKLLPDAESDLDFPVKIFGMIFSMAGALLFLIFGVDYLREAVIRLINPQWYVISMVLDLLNK